MYTNSGPPDPSGPPEPSGQPDRGAVILSHDAWIYLVHMVYPGPPSLNKWQYAVSGDNVNLVHLDHPGLQASGPPGPPSLTSSKERHGLKVIICYLYP